METIRRRRQKQTGPIELAIIGGGPKAAALAAKARVLRDLGKLDVRPTIFEPKAIGSYWRGDGGYTDGQQRLCTLAERDVGYPYSSLFGREVDLEMAAHHSWGRFLHERPDGYQQGFCTWLDAGRKPPYHSHYADYLSWVVRNSQSRVVAAEVTSLSGEDGAWRISCRREGFRARIDASRFHGVVVTGPGPARQIPLSRSPGVAAPRSKLFNGKDFWLRLKEVRHCLREMDKGSDDAQIVIAGAGGTAAAVLSWLIGEGARDRPIVIVASQASLYTRVDSVFENRLFSDETAWSTLSAESRRAFFDRLNRGVVWSTVMERVSTATGLTMLDGKATHIRVDANDEWSLFVERGDKTPIQLRPSFLIDATGFDPWWFLSIIKGLSFAAAPPERNLTEAWERAMSPSLQLTQGIWSDLPPLHAPMVSSHVGPGYGSLMVLGAMADRILGAYHR